MLLVEVVATSHRGAIKTITAAVIKINPRVIDSPAGSQMCHALAEPGGHARTPEDTNAGETEYRRTLEEPRGRRRTFHHAGSGP